MTAKRWFYGRGRCSSGVNCCVIRGSRAQDIIGRMKAEDKQGTTQEKANGDDFEYATGARLFICSFLMNKI
jgi:hypothetical protein